MINLDEKQVLLVGSVPLNSATEVFDAVGKHLHKHVASIPDGETGSRLGWIGWQREKLRGVRGLEEKGEAQYKGPAITVSVREYTLAEGFPVSDLVLPPLGYAEEAIKSYEKFKSAKSAGTIVPDARFQVSIPTPLIMARGISGPYEELLRVFEASIAREITSILAVVPAEELAIQFDSIEPVHEEVVRTPEIVPWAAQVIASWNFDRAIASMARVGDAVPKDALLGFHLCYGDPNGRHIVEPKDTSVLRDFANALSNATTRHIDWIHMPVPIERDDETYFRPLTSLSLQPDTWLVLGLVHHEDGIAGAKRRVAAARRFVSKFGIATECGMGRLEPSSIPGLLKLHGEVAEFIA